MKDLFDSKMLLTVVVAIVVGAIVSELVKDKVGSKLGLSSYEEDDYEEED